MDVKCVFRRWFGMTSIPPALFDPRAFPQIARGAEYPKVLDRVAPHPPVVTAWRAPPSPIGWAVIAPADFRHVSMSERARGTAGRDNPVTISAFLAIIKHA
jgi:hypothetical protein